MKLIGSLTSPYVRKVRIVLAEKKIDYDFELDSPWGAQTNVPNLNPLGKVPILVLDDETPLFDSRVICEYLDNVAPNNKLMPSPNRERTEVKRWEALADGLCDAAGLAMIEKKRPKTEQSADWISRQEQKIMASLEYMSNQLGEDALCTGMHFSLADIATGCALGYLSFRFQGINWEEKHPNLKRLHEKLVLRRAFAETLPRDS